ncbi:hypothetical protein C2S53_019221 [Perilla frutescens var. hirtella]|uniref:Receptor-like serine/threonine-protein kinase n=1 Tax=Perilla frutescens var. hirtella TaxID=608512 RepID=A0AAD4IRF8_PERFH|nr:hypothetical protein C2S53_019221 [Perilla frutescens var. hirtella]
MVQLSLQQLIFLFICLCFQYCLCLETDTISSSLVLKDPDTIVSQNKAFKLGFFSPGNTTNRYLGVFYAFSEETVVWVANRDTPLKDHYSSVAISKDGNLVLLNGRNQTVWSTNAHTSNISPKNTTLQILDTGNLVLRDNATGTTIWQSFSHPTNVYLPTMNSSYNIHTGKMVFLSSWKNETDPQVGNFISTTEVFNNIPIGLIRKNGRPYVRNGPWNGQIFLGVRPMFFYFVAGFAQVKNDSDGTFYYTQPLRKNFFQTALNSSGSLVETAWDDHKKSWFTVWEGPANECDIYGTCGPFGSCNIRNSPICSCLRGFEPTNKDEWERGNWTGGCRRKNPLQCVRDGVAGGNGDGFLRLSFMKIPDFVEPFSSSQIDECRHRCLGNCSCLAYAHDNNIGCMFWSNTLIDVVEFGDAGLDLYIRLSSSELIDKHQHKRLYIIIPVVAVMFTISTFVFIAWCWITKLKGVNAKMKNTLEEAEVVPSDSTEIVFNDESKVVNIGELPQFTFKMLANATDQFHENNLLGRGGFGPVYKGILANGKEIAVKRLAVDSGQGIQEFMNEVSVICKLQHRNLVRLLGGCVEKEEKILVYEYMPNKSLDVCLFDPTHPAKKILDCTKRINIIDGIGRGLLYLHRDSRLRIIHRDLKPSNVLLDDDWNPKISDFGMARIFRGNQDHCDTARVVGTYGYMAPEYAIHGRFSEKSDVFSFGVLLLEIIKGEKSTHYCNHERSQSLLATAWKLWSEDNSVAFVDESIGNNTETFKEEMGRCIQIGLLCVQEFPNDRPSVQTLMSMLTGEIVDLPTPERPVLSDNWNGLSSGTQIGISINHLTLTELHGR